MKRLLVVLFFVAGSAFAGTTHAAPSAEGQNADKGKKTEKAKLAPAAAKLTDDQVKDRIVDESKAEYLAQGHPCPCPENTARNGSRCGKRSAYSRPGGASPLCYPKDVSDEMVLNYRAEHRSN